MTEVARAATISVEHDPFVRVVRIRVVPERLRDLDVIPHAVRKAVSVVAAAASSIVGVLVDLRGVQHTERSDFLVASLAGVWGELLAHAPRLVIIGRHPELPTCDEAMVHDTEATALEFLLRESQAA